MSTMQRREFLIRAGSAAAVSAAAAFFPRAASANPLGLPLGIQLYVVAKDMREDAAAAIKRIAEIGYKEVETAGFGSLKTAAEVRRVLDDNGLKCPSAHLNFNLNDLQKAFDDANALGCTYATASVARTMILPPGQRSGMMAPMHKDELEKLADAMNKVGAAAKKNNLLFASHNHTEQFENIDGKTGMDFLITHTDPETVKFEIDCGWMAVAGYNPGDFVKRYPGRITMLHIKDFLKIEPGMQPGGPNSPLGAEIGTGVVDYKKIFAEVKGRGIQHIFVEQEGPYTRMPPMQAAEVDYKYLHALS